ncbi:DUF1939 domain-containing protein, partial [Candidatus Sumerlaeota bacterium]|nr:DUF1939 domain-containing protein [Candidatus Sumerlaeota bacterium]
LGGQYGNLITTLVDIHRENGRGAHRTRWVDGDVYIYERENALLVGLNDNGAFPADRSISNLAFRNVTLVELTGNPGASPTVSVDGDGNASVTIPSNGSGLGYAIWGLAKPRGSTTVDPFVISPLDSIIAPDDASVPNGVRRLTPIEVLTGDSATLTLSIESEGLDDNAIVEIDASGFSGFDTASPSHGGGTGVYSSTIDLTTLSEGIHCIEARAFLQRSPSSLPTIWETFRKVIYVDRAEPQVALLYPGQTGSDDVESTEYEVVLQSTDTTADSMHVLPDFSGSDAEAQAAISSATQASRVDRDEFRFLWSGITNGVHSLTVVAFEPTGNSSVTRFDNIDVSLDLPPIQFENLPDVISVAEYDDIRILVDMTNAGGDPYFFNPASADPRAFDLRLVIDGVTYPAQPYDPGLIGSVNTLYQNDDNLGDEFDVFRFNWRGYSAGLRSFNASAELINTTDDPSVIDRSVTVAASTPGPDFEILSPVPPASPGDPPTLLLIDPVSFEVTVGSLDPSARSLSVFLQTGESESLVASEAVDGTQATVTVTAEIGSTELFNGAATVRVQASTGPLGSGITHEESTSVLILGAADFIPPQGGKIIDGQDNDWTGTPDSTIHTAVVSGNEWIYTGEAADARTDLGDDTDIGNTDDAGDFNMDLTELRISQDQTNLYLLARMRDINDVRRTSFAIAIDTDGAGTLTFVGDESDTWLDTSSNTWDFTVHVHFIDTVMSRVEIFDDTGDPIWFSPEGEQSHISGENDLIEFAIPRSVLGLDGAEAEGISIQGATFENELTGGNGYNNDVDSTRDIGDENNPDALDVVGGEPGVSANAYNRAFSEGGLDTVIASNDPNVVLIYDLTIPAPGDSMGGSPPEIQSVSPPNLTAFTTATPVTVTIVTDTDADSVILAVNGAVVGGDLEGEVSGARTWTAMTPSLADGDNDVLAVAFGNSNFTGQTDIESLIYQVDLPDQPTLQEVVDHLLGTVELDEERAALADQNGSGDVDIGDVVILINP